MKDFSEKYLAQENCQAKNYSESAKNNAVKASSPPSHSLQYGGIQQCENSIQTVSTSNQQLSAVSPRESQLSNADDDNLKYVLIVDDNPVNLSVLAGMLKDEGLSYRVAMNGKDAFQVIEHQLPALILLDIQMPGMDGFEVCRLLKRNPVTAQIPVIFMTVVSDIESKTKGFSLGAVDYITKPFQSVELTARIKTHLQLHALTQNLEQKVLTRTTELQESEARQRRLFEQSPIGLALCRMDGSFVEVNAAYAAILGRTIPETLSFTCQDLTPITYAEEDKLLFEDLRLIGRYGPYEKEYIHKEGHLVPVRLSGTLIQRDGEILICSSVEDISDRKMMERKLHQVNDELIQANEKLVLATQLKDKFWAHMSHELRTPMNSVIGFSQLLQNDSSLSEKNRETIQIITRSGEHLLALINDILEISKIESGQAELNLEMVNLSTLLIELEELLQVKADRKQLQLKILRCDNLPSHIQVDKLKLKQVLLNLLDNAIKFTEVGEVSLAVKVVPPSSSTEDKQCLEFSVMDTGSGIAVESQANIFKPFIQSVEDQHFNQGTGLGLSISQKFVQMMEGNISVDSQPGQGSRFYFTLAVSSLSHPDRQELKPEHSATAIRKLESQHQGYRVLIVDDHVDNRELLSETLSLSGFEVEVASNGAEAVEKNEHWHPHLIWMDIQMPVMDGLQAAHHIKQSSHQPKIVALSAHAFEKERCKALAAGCDDFISKPFSIRDLFDKVEHLLDIEFTSDAQVAQSTVQSVQVPNHFDANISIAEGFSSMPMDWQTTMKKSIRSLDDQAVTDLLTQVPREQHRMVDAISKLLQDYRYDVLIDVLGINPQ